MASTKKRLRTWWRQLKHEQASPTRLGIAVFVGVLIGCSPFYGFQMLMAVGLAWVLRLNRIAVFLGANISIPPLTPFVVLAGVQTGEYLLHGAFLPFTLKIIQEMDPLVLFKKFFMDLLVGGLIVGSALGAALGYATYRGVSLARVRKLTEAELTEAELDDLLDRLEKVPRRFRGYGSWKVRLDPVYPLVLPLLSGRRELVDLGAGMGLLAALAQHRQPLLRIRAIEWDARKAAVARVLLGAGVSVEEGDARQVELGHPDAITLLDVLHYCSPEEQRAWLLRCADALEPGGVLVVRDLDSGERGSLAEKLDRWAVRWGWNKGAGVRAWPLKEMAQALRSQGFETSLRSAGKGLFRANGLLVATKRSPAIKLAHHD